MRFDNSSILLNDPNNMSNAIIEVFSPVLENTKDHKSIIQKTSLLSAGELRMHLKRCAQNNRESQKKIYSFFYGYAMAICTRYTNSYIDAIEILNDGFLKVFKEIHRCKPAYTDVGNWFKNWLRKTMIFTAIDCFRKNHRHDFIKDQDNEFIESPSESEDAMIDKISYDVIIRSVQQITPCYRIIFNLFVIDGFTHEEIAEHVGISIDTSKLNLVLARKQMHKILFLKNEEQATKNSQDSFSQTLHLY